MLIDDLFRGGFVFKYLMVLIFVVTASSMDSDDGTSVENVSQRSCYSNSDIILTPVNNYALSGLSSPRGMDLSNMYYELYIADPGDDVIYFVDPSNGNVNISFYCSPEIPNAVSVISAEFFGFSILVNNMEPDHDIWSFDTDWVYEFTNPVPHEPREMDVDPDGNLWCQDASDRKLYMFDYGGGNVTSWSLPDCPASYSMGLEVFEKYGNLGIILGGYTWDEFYFYEYDGINLIFLGSAAIPQTASASYGIAYSDNMDSFFWLYQDASSIYNICEFTVSEGSAFLKGSTWGNIKATF